MAETKDPFAAYRLPAGIADGTEIELGGTPAKFIVRLPSRFNDAYQSAVLRRVNMRPGPDGTARIDAFEMQEASRAAFVEQCIVRAEGLPDDMTAAEFVEQYPLALRALMDQAEKLAAETDKALDDLMGKSGDTSAQALNGLAQASMPPSQTPSAALASSRAGKRRPRTSATH